MSSYLFSLLYPQGIEVAGALIRRENRLRDQNKHGKEHKLLQKDRILKA